VFPSQGGASSLLRQPGRKLDPPLPLPTDSTAILETIAEYADKHAMGRSQNKYCGEPNERPIIRSIVQGVSVDRALSAEQPG